MVQSCQFCGVYERKTEGISQDSFVENEAEFGLVASTRCIDSDCKLSIFSCDLCQLGIAAYYIVKECRSTTTLFDIVEKCNRSGLELINQGSHSDWKTWKNGKAFSSQGKVREF